MKEYGHEFADFFYFNPTPFERSGGIWPIRAGRNIAKRNYQVGPKLIECYSIHFVMEGRVQFLQGDNKVSLEKGDMYCLYPGLAYQYHTLSIMPPLQMRWFAFQGPQSEALLRFIGVTPANSCRRNVLDESLQITLEHMFATFAQLEENKTRHIIQLESLIYQLFGRLLPRHHAGDDTVEKRHKEPDWVRESMDYMDIHFTEGITVDDVAVYAGVHRSYFSAVFSQHAGIAPVQYLQRLRLTKGVQLLTETDHSVSEIALSLGYPDLYSFTRAFRNYFGKPPTKFRNSS